MSLLSIKEIHNGRDGDDEVSKQKGIRRYTRVYRAVTTSNTDDAKVVLAGAPNLGAVHPNDSRAYCRRRRARNESFSKRVWIVTLAYSTEREMQENPLTDPAEIEWATEQFQRPCEKDKDGNGIVNSAGDPPDPPAQRDDSRVTATISKNLATVPSWILTYRDAVNDDAFQLDGITIPKGIAKIQAVRVSKWQERNDYLFRVVTLTMHFAPTDEEDWPITFLDRGFRERIDGVMYQITNGGDKEEVTAPVKLNGAGRKLEDPPPCGVFMSYDVYNQMNFSVLPLT